MHETLRNTLYNIQQSYQTVLKNLKDSFLSPEYGLFFKPQVVYAGYFWEKDMFTGIKSGGIFKLKFNDTNTILCIVYKNFFLPTWLLLYTAIPIKWCFILTLLKYGLCLQ